MNVYLDDIRTCPDGWVHVKTAKEAINVLANNKVEAISLDHDLGEPEIENGTGNDVLLWIEEQVHTNPCYHCPVITVHSDNSSASYKMTLGIRAITTFLSKKQFIH